MNGPARIYEIRRTFRVPLSYAFAWCTDYTSEDRELEGETGSRQILRTTPRTAVYEDLTPSPHGWMWSRFTVTLRPPDRWTAVAEGNYRSWKLAYSLRALADDKTEFRMRGERRATPLGGRNPSKAALEKELSTMWKNLGAALERDYRSGRPPRSRRR